MRCKLYSIILLIQLISVTASAQLSIQNLKKSHSVKPHHQVSSVKVEIDPVASRLRNEIGELLLEAENPNNLLVGKTDPAQRLKDLAQLESDFTTWKAEIESKLAGYFPDAEGAPPNIYYDKAKFKAFEVEQDKRVAYAAVQIVNYQEVLSRIIEIRAAIGGMQEVRTSDSFRVPLALIGKVSGFDEVPGFEKIGSVQDMLLDSTSPIVVDLSHRSGRFVSLHLGSHTVHGIVVNARARDSSDETLIKTVHLMAVAALYDRFQEVAVLRGNAIGDIPRLSRSLRDEMGVVSDFDNELDAKQKRIKEEPFRNAIFATFPGIIPIAEHPAVLPEKDQAVLAKMNQLAAMGWQFTTPELVQSLVSLLMEDPSLADPEAVAFYTQALVNAENLGFQQLFEQAVIRFPLPLYGMDQNTLTQALRTIVAKAKYRSILEVLRNTKFPPEKAEQLATVIEQAVARYTNAIPESQLIAWEHEAIQQQYSLGVDLAKNQAVDQMIKSSLDLYQSTHTPKEALPMDFTLLKRALQDDLGAMSGTKSAAEFYDLILSIPDFKLAREYQQKAEARLRAETQLKGVDDQARTHDLNALYALGKLLNWNKITEAQLQHPKVGDFNLSPAQQDLYKDAFTKMQMRVSLLSLKVDGKPLFEQVALAAQKNDHAEAVRIIDRGAAVIESNIRKDLNEISEINTVQKVADFMSNSGIMKDLLEQNTPILQAYEKQLLEMKMRSDSRRKAATQLFDTYLNPLQLMMYVSIGKLIPTLFLRPTSPIMVSAGRISSVIEPNIQGYETIAGASFFAKTFGLLSIEAYSEYQKKSEMEDFFYTSVSGNSFYDYFNVTLAEDTYHATMKEWWGNVKLMAGFMAGGWMANAVKGYVRERVFVGMKNDFSHLGFSQQDMQSLPWDKPKQLKVAISDAAGRRIDMLRSGETSSADIAGQEQQISDSATNLIKQINKQEREANLWAKDMAPRFRKDLGIEPTFDLGKVRIAREKIEENYADGKASADEVIQARRTEDFIVRLHATEQKLTGPGPLEVTKNGVRKIFGMDPLKPKDSDAIKVRIFKDVFGFEGDLDGVTARRAGAKFDSSPFKILGVDKNATDAEIKKAWRKLAFQYAPDRNPNNPAALEKFREAKDAYELIFPPPRRPQITDYAN